MLFFSRSKILMICGAVFIGLLLAIPNALNETTREKMPNAFQRTINLGLDLQGGAHMLLEVDLSSILDQALINERTAINDAFRRAEDRPSTEFVRTDDGTILARMRTKEDADKAMPLLRALSQPVDPTQLNSAKTTRVERETDKNIRVTITDQNIEYIRKQTIEKSIGVLGRRIDPNGNLELILAPEGDKRILLQVPGAQNIDEIKERINKSANLSFHLVNEKDSTNEQAMSVAMETGRVAAGDKYYPFSAENGRGGGLIVVDRTRITGECLKDSSGGPHPTGPGAVVNFSFNVACATEFGRMTARNINKRFAVILDGEIITAPNINTAITGGSGYIEGGFTMESARDLALLLNAGALPAKLTIVEERTVDPSLGADSIRAGKVASAIGLLGVFIFMWLSYGLRFGTIANMALATNIILIAAALSLFGSTLTLPGIAGIILTIGMAVDANVLIFERIREETYNGKTPINAIETGYKRSMAPILDANITTLIAAITLYFVGSGPVRGFAVTLAIGIVMSVFTAVIFARLLTATWLRGKRPKTLPI
ncbi:MAG: protein translocase subunit SecD [Litorimonas sp.]